MDARSGALEHDLVAAHELGLITGRAPSLELTSDGRPAPSPFHHDERAAALGR